MELNRLKNEYSFKSQEDFNKALESSNNWTECPLILNRGYSLTNMELWFIIKGKERKKITYNDFITLLSIEPK